jgi:hypothetical protein
MYSAPWNGLSSFFPLLTLLGSGLLINVGLSKYSLYSMAFNIFRAATTWGFYLWQIWRPPFSLEYWLVIAYDLILIVPIWGCIGLADNINFGFKVTIPLMA